MAIKSTVSVHICTHYDNNRVVFVLSLSVFHSIFSLVFVLLSFSQTVFLVSIFFKVDLHLKLEANKRQRRHAFVLCTFNLPFFCCVPFSRVQFRLVRICQVLFCFACL